MACKTCGGETVQKGRRRLLLVGVLLLASTGVAAVHPYLWAAGALLFLAGAYLVAWATLGRGRWCRACKRFSVS
jgi:hypothetical protein